MTFIVLLFLIRCLNLLYEKNWIFCLKIKIPSNPFHFRFLFHVRGPMILRSNDKKTLKYPLALPIFEIVYFIFESDKTQNTINVVLNEHGQKKSRSRLRSRDISGQEIIGEFFPQNEKCLNVH